MIVSECFDYDKFLEFAFEYVKGHTYIRTKNISKLYLEFTKYPYSRNEYSKLLYHLSMFLATNLIRRLRKNGVIEHYNNNSVYKRIRDIDYTKPKTQPITIKKEVPVPVQELPNNPNSRLKQHYEFSKFSKFF